MGTELQYWQAALYTAKAAELVLYGRALGLSREESEDVVHDTFAALLKLPEPPRAPWFYCLRAFRHRALNCHRGFWRRLKREFESAAWFEQENRPDSRETAAIRCLQQLPMEQREVIALKIWQKQTFEEIGALLNLSPNTAGARYRYGLVKIRKCLEMNYEQRNESLGEPVGFLETA